MVLSAAGATPNPRALAQNEAFAGFGEIFNAAFDAPTLLHVNPFSDNRSLLGIDYATREADQRAVREARSGLGLLEPRGYAESRQAARTGRFTLDEDEKQAVQQKAYTPAPELEERYKSLGLKFPRGMSDEAAEILAEAKRREILRNDVFDAGQGGVTDSLAMLGGGLAGAALDPIEIGSAFLPIVGAARRVRMAASIGTVPAAIAAGAIEGAAGNLLLEPLYFGLSGQAQLDYTMHDALFNTALGGLMGAGIGGAIRAGGVLRGREDPYATEIVQNPAAYGDDDVRLASRVLGQMVRGERPDVPNVDPDALRLVQREIDEVARQLADDTAAALTGQSAPVEIGGPQLAQLAGPRAQTADLGALGRAKAMEARGESSRDIRVKTGWTRGPEGWVFQIDPQKVRWADGVDVEKMLSDSIRNRTLGRGGVLGDLLDAPELFAAYPKLRDLPVTIKPGERGGEYQFPIGRQITISGGKDRSDALALLRHEVQHAIQDQELRVRRPRPVRSAYEAIVSYHRSPEEIEARFSETGRPLTGRPAEDFDVPQSLVAKAEEDLTFDDFRLLTHLYLKDRVAQGLTPQETAYRLMQDQDNLRAMFEDGRRDLLTQTGAATGRMDAEKAAKVSELAGQVMQRFLQTMWREFGMAPAQIREALPEFGRVVRMAVGDERVKGAFMRDTGAIGLSDAADASTVAHELWHAFWDAMSAVARRDDASPDLRRLIEEGRAEAERQVEASGVERGASDPIRELHQERAVGNTPHDEIWGNFQSSPKARAAAARRLDEIAELSPKDLTFDDAKSLIRELKQVLLQANSWRSDLNWDQELPTFMDALGLMFDTYIRKRGEFSKLRADPPAYIRNNELFYPDDALFPELVSKVAKALDAIAPSAKSDVARLLANPSAQPRRGGQNRAYMPSGFYFQAARLVDQAPAALFDQGGAAVVNWMRKNGLTQAEERHLQLIDAFGAAKKVSREAIKDQIKGRSFDFVRRVKRFDPENPSNDDYEVPRAFAGPRVPGSGVYFERLMAFPKRLRDRSQLAAGQFQSTHWGDELAGTWASWRGSLRRVEGWGDVLLGEEGQADLMQSRKSKRQQDAPETPLDERYVRTMVRDLLIAATREDADTIAISTSDTTARIQNNASAAWFYDEALKPALEKELRRITQRPDVTLERVALPKTTRKKGGKAFTVWAARLDDGAKEIIRTEGLPLFQRSGSEADFERATLELIARGGEAYLMTGRAPIPALARLYRIWANLLRDIYRTAEELDVELTPELRRLYDRMLSTEEERVTGSGLARVMPRDEDDDAARRIERALAETPDDELQAIAAELETLNNRVQAAGGDFAEIEPFDGAVARAKTYARAVEAAGACVTRG